MIPTSFPQVLTFFDTFFVINMMIMSINVDVSNESNFDINIKNSSSSFNSSSRASPLLLSRFLSHPLHPDYPLQQLTIAIVVISIIPIVFARRQQLEEP